MLLKSKRLIYFAQFHRSKQQRNSCACCTKLVLLQPSGRREDGNNADVSFFQDNALSVKTVMVAFDF